MLIHVDKYILEEDHDNISYTIQGINWCCDYLKKYPSIEFENGYCLHGLHGSGSDSPCIVLLQQVYDGDGDYFDQEHRIAFCPFCGEKIEIVVLNVFDKINDIKMANNEIFDLQKAMRETDSKSEVQKLTEKARKIENMTTSWRNTTKLWNKRDEIPEIKQHFDNQENQNKVPLSPRLSEMLANAKRRTPEESAEIVKKYQERMEEREKNPLFSEETFKYIMEEFGVEFPVELPEESIYLVVDHICQYDKHGDKLSEWAKKQLGAWFEDPVNWDLLFYEWDYDMRVDYWDSIHEAIGQLEEEVSPLNRQIEHLKQIDKYIGQQYGEELRREGEERNKWKTK